MESEEKEVQGNKDRKVTVRFEPGEYTKIENRFKETTCRTISEYIRNYLFNRKITTNIRNASMDDFMEELLLARKELNALANNFNQVVRKINGCQNDTELKKLLPVCIQNQEQLLREIGKMQKRIDQFSDKWLQE